MIAVPLASQHEPIPGYKLIERLGRGGFGEVWRCEAPGGFQKAIKLVYGNLDVAGDEGKAAEQELKALKRIKEIRHAFILSLERCDIVDGQLMIVMELADRSLWDRFRECRTQNLPGIPRDELLRYMTESAEALDLMNEVHNLQHLDIKPQNLFLVHNHVKVADFGLVKVFEGLSASVTGGVTPVYAAPETFEDRVTRFSDQYSLAIVYQELLTGVRPFNGTNTRQLILQHLTQPPDLKPLPDSDREAVGRSLAKRPEDRFPNCSAFVTALRSRLDAAPQVGVHPSSSLAAPMNGQQPQAYQIPTASQMISRPDPTYSQPIGPAMPTMQRPDYVAVSAPVARLPMAPPEQTGDGVLMPAVVIGVGATGGQVVRYLRRAIHEQFGGIESIPNIRLLTIDTDAESLPRGRDSIHVRMHRPSHYLSKANDAGGLEWLPHGLLYRLPRNPVTTGLRGLGRLAFWDHAAALERRIRLELESVLLPTALPEADRHTRLGLRKTHPRVYLVANPAGGTGGGMILDLAYLTRHSMRKLGYAHPDVVGVMLLPPTEKPTSRPAALANVYATLAELAHYSRRDTSYELRYSSKDPPVVDSGRSFARCVCLPQSTSANSADTRHSTTLASGLLFRELLTPLGRAADESRPELEGQAYFSTVGTFRLAWPRRRLIRSAGRQLAAQLIQQWTGKEFVGVRDAVTAWLDEQWELRQLRPERLIERLQSACQTALGQSPDSKFEAMVAPLSERGELGVNSDSLAVCRILSDLVELVGKPDSRFDDETPGLLLPALESASRGLAAEYDQKLAELAVHFIELPQHRLCAAEEAVRQLGERLKFALDAYDSLHKSLSKEAAEVYSRLLRLISSLDGATREGKRSSLTAEIVELMRSYPKKRYQSLVAGRVLTMYRGMANASPEYLREVNFCRQRLTDAGRHLEQVASDAKSSSPFGPGRDLLPGGRRNLEESAIELVSALSAEDLAIYDQLVQQQVRTQFRALVNFCLESNGQAEALAQLMCQQAEEYLNQRLGQSSAAGAIYGQISDDPQAAHRIAAEAYDEAEPALDITAGSTIDLLAAPAGTGDEYFRQIVSDAIPEAQFQAADSADEVVFYRERIGITVTDLPHFSPTAKAAYDAVCKSDAPPHARADVKWKPPTEQ